MVKNDMVQHITSTPGEKVTLADIARISNVSPSTVSLVLRDKPGVGEETRQRVKEVAQSLGYIPPVAAVASHTLHHIGLVMKVDQYESPEVNHFYASVVTGIEAVCRKQQSHLLYANLPVDDHNQPLDLPRLLTDEQIDGLLMIGMELTEDLLVPLRERGLPIVLVDGYAGSDAYDAVVTDNLRGGMEATAYLLGRGHDRIALVGSQPDAYPSIRERRAGYVQAMQAHGRDPLFADCGLDPKEAGDASAEIVAQHPDITAFFACNDEMALAVLKTMRQLGKRVPEDVSIVGFDNIALAQHVTPALTTMRVDKMTMGRLGAQLLFNRLAYPDASHVRSIILPQLIERESVATLKGS